MSSAEPDLELIELSCTVEALKDEAALLDCGLSRRWVAWATIRSSHAAVRRAHRAGRATRVKMKLIDAKLLMMVAL